MLIVFPIVALVVRDRPQAIGLEPYGATEPVPVPERSPHPFRPAIDGLLLGVRSRTFWLLCGDVLHLRPLDERPDRHASDPGRRWTTA